MRYHPPAEIPRWNVGDLAIWDNTCTLHLGVGDYDNYRRMQRVTVRRLHAAKATG